MTVDKALANAKASADRADGVAHRFDEFSDDFATRAVFRGPAGGES